MARYRSRYPSPPDDVCDTREEVDAYYRDMEDEADRMMAEEPDPGEY